MQRRIWGSAIAAGSLALAMSAGHAAFQARGQQRSEGPLAANAEVTCRMSPEDMTIFNSVRTSGARRMIEAGAAVAQRGSSIYAVFNAEFDSPASCQRFVASGAGGAGVVNRFDKWVDLFVPNQTVLEHLCAAPGIVWSEMSGVARVPPPQVGRTIPRRRGRSESIVRGGIDGLTGRGVIVAIVDSGIDIHHRDFIRTDAAGKPTSRLLYYWDTLGDSFQPGQWGGRAPASYPSGASIGTIYSRAQLTAELRAKKPHPIAWDAGGHGTSCAGIAAGNGAGLSPKKYVGVAPDADLIAVRVGRDRQISNGYLIGAVCRWLQSVAGSRPVVISCSWGGHQGGHDGSRLDEREISALFPPTAPARAICFAAGNEAEDPLHAEIGVGAADVPSELTWMAQSTGQLDLYFGSGDYQNLRVTLAGQEPRVLTKDNGYIHPITKQLVIPIKIQPGPGKLSLASDSSGAIRADAYIYGYRGDAAFDQPVAFSRTQISSPGTADGAITVGSYDWNDQFDHHGRLLTVGRSGGVPLVIGDLSSYSNPGFSRAGNVKPEIVAPGQYFTAPLSADARPNTQDDYVESSGRYQIFNGTSAATPYTAGVIALLMQKKRTITAGQIKNLLRTYASHDQYTGEVPNPRFGYGKLDLKAVRAMIRAVR